MLVRIKYFSCINIHYGEGALKKQICMFLIFPHKRQQGGNADPTGNSDEVAVRSGITVPQRPDDLEHITFPELGKRQGPLSTDAI